MTQLMNPAFIGPLKHAGCRSLLVWRHVQCVAATRQLRKQNIFTPQTGLGCALMRLDHRTGDGCRITVRRVAYYAGVVAAVDVMAFATFTAVVIAGIAAYFAALRRVGFKVKRVCSPDGTSAR